MKSKSIGRYVVEKTASSESKLQGEWCYWEMERRKDGKMEMIVHG